MSTQIPAGYALRDVEVGVRHPPEAGIHGFLYAEARRLLDMKLTPESVGRVLLEANETWWHLRRKLPEREILETVQNAYADLGRGPVQLTAEIVDFLYDAERGWPEQYHLPIPQFDDLAAKTMASSADVKTVAELTAKSGPIPRMPLREMFAPDEWVCCGTDSDNASVRRMSDWSDSMLEDKSFVVPGPMRSDTVFTPEGKRLFPRRRCNVGARRYIVLESDNASLSKNEKAAILWGLSCGAPLVCVVDSGGKSLHGWYCVTHAKPSALREWFRIAVSLGCDHVTWKPEQYVRVPNGTRRRANIPLGTIQQTLYFNPSAISLK